MDERQAKIAKKDAIREAGGPAALARKLGITSQAISQWGDRIPAGHVLKVERASGVSRHLLRPDLYPVEEKAGAA